MDPPDFAGACFRCERPGHWHDSPQCPLLTRARTLAEHEKRIAEYGRRYTENQLSRARKAAFINEENDLWKRRTA